MKVPGKRQKPLVETQMVSLADIAFLIIFFFMMTSSFMRDKKVDLALPVLPRTDHSEAPISVSIDKNGKLYLDGEEMASPAALGNTLKGRLQNKKPEECKVRFRCDKTVQHKVYAPVIEAVAGAGATVGIIHQTPK